MTTAARLTSLVLGGQRVVLVGEGRHRRHRAGQRTGVRARLTHGLLRLDDARRRHELHRPGDLLRRADGSDALPVLPDLRSHTFPPSWFCCSGAVGLAGGRLRVRSRPPGQRFCLTICSCSDSCALAAASSSASSPAWMPSAPEPWKSLRLKVATSDSSACSVSSSNLPRLADGREQVALACGAGGRGTRPRSGGRPRRRRRRACRSCRARSRRPAPRPGTARPGAA